jgi:hypothetical protein
MTISKIKVKELMPETLDTRESATLLAQFMKQESLSTKIELDFNGILFMSRSFADQFHKEIYANENHIDLCIKNADVQITDILNAVSRTQENRKKHINTYNLLQLTDLDKLTDYTFAW